MHYASTKYMMLRIHKQPEMLSKTIGTFFANFMPYVAFIWAVGFITFFTILNNSYDPQFDTENFIDNYVRSEN